MSFVWALTFLALIAASTGVAPGDEAQRCEDARQNGHLEPIIYAEHVRALMDSRNYEYLLNHNEAVWEEVNMDTSNSIDDKVSLIIIMRSILNSSVIQL